MRVHIIFEFKDTYTNGGWRKQKCDLSADTVDAALKKCREWYGLDEGDCEYKIVEIKTDR